MINHEGHDFVICTLLLFLFSLAVRAWVCVKQSIIEGGTQFYCYHCFIYIYIYRAISLLHEMVLQRFLIVVYLNHT